MLLSSMFTTDVCPPPLCTRIAEPLWHPFKLLLSFAFRTAMRLTCPEALRKNTPTRSGEHALISASLPSTVRFLTVTPVVSSINRIAATTDRLFGDIGFSLERGPTNTPTWTLPGNELSIRGHSRAEESSTHIPHCSAEGSSTRTQRHIAPDSIRNSAQDSRSRAISLSLAMTVVIRSWLAESS